MKRSLLAGSIFALAPLFAFAQADLSYISGLVVSTQAILNLLIPLVVTIAIILFFWGLAVFILNAGDEEARAKGRSIMIWGIVALFVIVAVWGIVAVLANIFNVETGTSAPVPGVGEVDTTPTPF